MADETHEPDNVEHEPQAPVGVIESRSDKFIRLANYRTAKAIERIRQLGYLSNRAQYDFTPEQISKIREALSMEVYQTLLRFEKGDKEKPLFEL